MMTDNRLKENCLYEFLQQHAIYKIQHKWGGKYLLKKKQTIKFYIHYFCKSHLLKTDKLPMNINMEANHFHLAIT